MKDTLQLTDCTRTLRSEAKDSATRIDWYIVRLHFQWQSYKYKTGVETTQKSWCHPACLPFNRVSKSNEFFAMLDRFLIFNLLIHYHLLTHTFENKKNNITVLEELSLSQYYACTRLWFYNLQDVLKSKDRMDKTYKYTSHKNNYVLIIYHNIT